MAMNDDKKKRANTYRTPLPGYVDDVVPQVSTAPAVRPVAAPAPAPAPAPVVPPAVAQKPYQPGFLPGAKLIPGSTADTIANAVSGFKANYNAKLQTGEQQRLANNLNFIDPANPASMKLAPPSAAVQKPAVAAPKPMPAPMPGAPATTANKSPSQSMTLDQANAREVAAQTARRPGTQAGAGAPPAAGAAALPMPQRPNEVIGQYNGRNITRGQADAYASKLPTSNGPVAMGPNNSFAYTPSGGSPAAPIERPTPAPAGPAPDAPSGPAPRKADSSAAREAEKAAAKFRSDIGSEIFRLSFAAGRGGRDGRAAKEAIASLMGLAGQSVEGSGKRAVDVASGDRDAAAGADKTGAEQAGADRRAQIDFRAKQMQDGTERYKADLGAIQRPETITDAGGRLLLRQGGETTQVMGPDGQPVTMPQAVQTQAGQITPQDQYKALNDQLTALLKTPPMLGAAPEDVAAYNQQVTALQARRDALVGGQAKQGAVTVKSAADLAKLPKGATYIAPDGKTYIKN